MGYNYGGTIVGVQLSSCNSVPNSGNNHHLIVPFEGAMHSFKRQGSCVSRELNVRIYRVVCIGGTEGTDIQGGVYRGD